MLRYLYPVQHDDKSFRRHNDARRGVSENPRVNNGLYSPQANPFYRYISIHSLPVSKLKYLLQAAAVLRSSHSRRWNQMERLQCSSTVPASQPAAELQHASFSSASAIPPDPPLSASSCSFPLFSAAAPFAFLWPVASSAAAELQPPPSPISYVDNWYPTTTTTTTRRIEFDCSSPFGFKFSSSHCFRENKYQGWPPSLCALSHPGRILWWRCLTMARRF